VADIPALTVRNPWAWAAVEPGPGIRKPVENRSRFMKYRGPLWWHAGARSRWDPAGEHSALVREAWVVAQQDLENLGRPPLNRHTDLMPFGAVSALVEVTGCHHADECLHVGLLGQLMHCSPWAAAGQFHTQLADVRPLADPVPCKGALGLWRLPEDVNAACRARLDGPGGSQ
jgi:hypothetical protein